MKYIDGLCRDCDEYIEPYGCTYHDCPIYQGYEIGRAEMEADFEHDKRKEDRIHPIFQQALAPFLKETK